MNTSTVLYKENVTNKEVLELQDECLSSIRNTLKIAANANDVSRYGSTKLNEHTEQLCKIESDSRKISDNLKKTEEAISSIRNPILFWFKGLFRRNEPHIENLEVTSSVMNIRNNQPENEFNISKNDSEKQSDMKSSKSSEFVPKSINSEESRFSDQVEEGLNQIDGMLKEMHSRAVNMNLVLRSQGEIIDKISHNINDNNIKIRNQRKELGRLIGK